MLLGSGGPLGRRSVSEGDDDEAADERRTGADVEPALVAAEVRGDGGWWALRGAADCDGARI